MPRWRVDLIGKKLQHVGTIEADTEEQAIDEAAKLFGLDASRRSMLVAQKISTRDEKA
jgi:hypothetical protein